MKTAKQLKKEAKKIFDEEKDALGITDFNHFWIGYLETKFDNLVWDIENKLKIKL